MTFFLVLLVIVSCVGPAEPKDGLVEDIPFIVNSATIFSFILKGNKYSFEESYSLSLSVDSTGVITTTISVTEWSGSDTVWATVKTASDSVLSAYIITGNSSLVTNQNVTTSTVPKNAVFKGNQFKGILEFVMAKN